MQCNYEKDAISENKMASLKPNSSKQLAIYDAKKW